MIVSVGAIEAYLDTDRRYEFLSLYLNGGTPEASRLAIAAGSSYERLGKYREAVNVYLLTGDPRAADLFAATGQLRDLRRILDRRDAECIEAVLASKWNTTTRESLERAAASTTLRRALELYARAEAGDWEMVVNALRSHSSLFDSRSIAANVMARYPDVAIPIVELELTSVDGSSYHYCHMVLGLCGTPEAVVILETRARAEENCWQCYSLVSALSLAGPSGRAAIARLDRTATYNLLGAIDLFKDDKLPEGFRPLPFPAIPPDLKLPKEL